MTIYVVEAVDICSDYPHKPEPVSYHKTLESALKKAEEINQEYEYSEANGWYDEEGYPLCQYQSKAFVAHIEVLD